MIVGRAFLNWSPSLTWHCIEMRDQTNALNEGRCSSPASYIKAFKKDSRRKRNINVINVGRALHFHILKMW